MGLKPLNKKLKKPELLAPAGDLKRCKTAIRYGADAVYLGGKVMGLRALRSRASNFSMQEIKEACAFAKRYGARIHVTVNMIPHEEDFEGLKEYILQLEEAGVYAVIVASCAIMKLVKETSSKLEVHCSTQMSVTNAASAAFLYETIGVDRVVLARECTMDEVKKITANCPVETEAFIHGGMCVNYSGRCTLSNRMTYRDANRGGCAQRCRWQYHLLDEDKELSTEKMLTIGSKDLMSADWIYDLMAAGVSSFKIEGRMKTEYYVASIVSAYRRLIDEIYEAQAPLSINRMAYHKNQIMYAQNRDVSSVFYEGNDHLNDTLIYHMTSNADVNHDFLGTVISYDPSEQTAIIETRNIFTNTDHVELLSPYGLQESFTVGTIVNDHNEEIDTARHPMAKVKIHVPFEAHEEDILRRSHT